MEGGRDRQARGLAGAVDDKPLIVVARFAGACASLVGEMKTSRGKKTGGGTALRTGRTVAQGRVRGREVWAAVAMLSILGAVWGPANILVAEYADFPVWLRRVVFVFGAPVVRMAFELWVLKRVLRGSWAGAFRTAGLSTIHGRQLGLALLVSAPAVLAAALPGIMGGPPYPTFGTLAGRSAWLFLVVGLGEELTYRGILFRLLRLRLRFLPAAAVSGLLFALPHMLRAVKWLPGPLQNTEVLGAALAVFPLIMSFPLAAMFERGGWSLWGPVVWHFCVDLRVILYADYLYRPSTARTAIWMQVLIGVSLAAAVWAVRRLRKRGAE